MGVSTSAKLIYGYRLKTDDEWLVREKHDENSDLWGLKLDWLDDDDDFQDKAEDRLLAAVGFEDSGYDTDPDGWRARRRAARQQVGVEFEYGGYELGDLLLAAKTYTIDLGEAKTIDPAELVTASGEKANTKLRWALEVLGLTPTQDGPAWLLTPCRG
jgi:hypothetical protein